MGSQSERECQKDNVIRNTSRPGLPQRTVKPKMVKVQASALKKKQIIKPKGPAPPPPLNVVIPLEEEEKILNLTSQCDSGDSMEGLSCKGSESLEELTASARKNKQSPSRIGGDSASDSLRDGLNEDNLEPISAKPEMSSSEPSLTVGVGAETSEIIVDSEASLQSAITSTNTGTAVNPGQQNLEKKAAQEEHVKKLLEALQKSKPREWKTADSDSQVEKFKMIQLNRRASDSMKQTVVMLPELHGLQETDVDADESEEEVEMIGRQDRSSSWGSKKDVPVAAVKPVGHTNNEHVESDDEEEVEDLVLKDYRTEDPIEEDSDLMQSILSELSSRDVDMMNGTTDSEESIHKEFSKGLSLEDINASFDMALAGESSVDDNDDDNIVLDLKPVEKQSETQSIEDKTNGITIKDNVIAIDLTETDIDTVIDMDGSVNDTPQKEKNLKLTIPPPHEFADSQGTPISDVKGRSTVVSTPSAIDIVNECAFTPDSPTSSRRSSGRHRPKQCPPPPPPENGTTSPTGTLERRRSKKGKAPPPPQSPILSTVSPGSNDLNHPPGGSKGASPHPLSGMNGILANSPTTPTTPITPPQKKSVRFSPSKMISPILSKKPSWLGRKPKTPPKPVIQKKPTPYRQNSMEIEIVGMSPVLQQGLGSSKTSRDTSPPKRPPPPRPPPPKVEPTSPVIERASLKRNMTDSQLR